MVNFVNLILKVNHLGVFGTILLDTVIFIIRESLSDLLCRVGGLCSESILLFINFHNVLLLNSNYKDENQNNGLLTLISIFVERHPISVSRFATNSLVVFI